ncbi:4-phosphoerythronate dehydrogenase [Paludibacter propionicigenes WB4]|uniref:Erythronate-4-phosphate dehydrogenase n=1 Tax=Paludibacter propionicigenes (strain DSM 17365 / JCM 13257 / WB4) TaxID=694427 RepID=E4T1Y0_PALPW|nr:4-phosphoerythronate dehydrogenase PdxB [Paludibacter propionicigenes]ADQ78724.1 4-phosphoerythronate dehydrogenase [Paludibacter propionicigenes WB4]
MKIIIDDKIPYIQGAFEGVVEVIYLPGNKTTPEIVKDADAIVTRTRTICNEQLLAGSAVKFIATATIGYDHIDTDYCEAAGIQWTNAPGCNSKSVEQYIASALLVLAQKNNWILAEKCIGIVGVGNVGSKVATVCKLLGMKVLLNDPPRERAEGKGHFVSLQHVLDEADIISLHVPLNMTGEDATFHLCDRTFFTSLKRKPVLINSCRGEVIDTTSVKEALQSGALSGFVCDCWENEPDIDLELLALTDLATPHIAGYSRDGKATGTLMSVQAISNFFSLGLNNWRPLGVELPVHPVIEIDGTGLTEQDIIAKAVLSTYDIRDDDRRFRADTTEFEMQRGDYPVRREFTAYTLHTVNVPEAITEKLKQLGFMPG